MSVKVTGTDDEQDYRTDKLIGLKTTEVRNGPVNYSYVCTGLLATLPIYSDRKLCFLCFARLFMTEACISKQIERMLYTALHKENSFQRDKFVSETYTA